MLSMDKNNLNISKVETFLNGIIDNVVSKNTLFTRMIDKETIPADWQDMCLIEIPGGIEDMNAYGIGTVLVWLYARPLSSGRKNVAVMSQLEQRLNKVIEETKEPNITLTRRDTYTDYDTSINWHCNCVEIVLRIF